MACVDALSRSRKSFARHLTAHLIAKLMDMFYICFLQPRSGIHFTLWRRSMLRVQVSSLTTAALSRMIMSLNHALAYVAIISCR